MRNDFIKSFLLVGAAAFISYGGCAENGDEQLVEGEGTEEGELSETEQPDAPGTAFGPGAAAEEDGMEIDTSVDDSVLVTSLGDAQAAGAQITASGASGEEEVEVNEEIILEEGESVTVTSPDGEEKTVAAAPSADTTADFDADESSATIDAKPEDVDIVVVKLDDEGNEKQVPVTGDEFGISKEEKDGKTEVSFDDASDIVEVVITPKNDIGQKGESTVLVRDDEKDDSELLDELKVQMLDLKTKIKALVAERKGFKSKRKALAKERRAFKKQIKEVRKSDMDRAEKKELIGAIRADIKKLNAEMRGYRAELKSLGASLKALRGERKALAREMRSLRKKMRLAKKGK